MVLAVAAGARGSAAGARRHTLDMPKPINSLPIESSRGSGCIELVLLTFCNPVTSRNTRRTQRGLYRRARINNAAVQHRGAPIELHCRLVTGLWPSRSG